METFKNLLNNQKVRVTIFFALVFCLLYVAELMGAKIN